MTDIITIEVPRLYSVAAAAELLEVSTDYIYDRIKADDFPVVELGHGRAKQRISATALQAFIDSRTFGAQTASSPTGPVAGNSTP